MSTSPLLRQLLKKGNEAEKNKERKKKKKAAARDAGSSSHAVTATTPSVESRTSEKTTSSLLTSQFMAVSFQEFFVESLEESPATREEEVWRNLRESIVYYDGKSVGTLAAKDQVAEALSYNQVFVGDFIPAGLAFLMKKPAESEIEKNFLIKTLHLQGREKKDNFTDDDSPGGKETVFADFGGSAIGRVAPVDSGFWWIIFLRAYAICTGDHTLQERPEMQKGMIDRWMGINERQDDLIDEMPLQVAYPALEGDERKTITGFDPKNMRWSYHNGGSYPTLLWKTALTSAVGSGTEVTGTLPPAASPALGKDGASKPVEGMRKREEGSDGGGDRVRRPRVLQEVNLQPAIAEGSMAVFWKSRNGYCQLLGMVEGVQHMTDRRQLEDAVEQVLNEHNRPINRDKIYYSQWTNMRMHVLFITRMPWQMFRTAVRGVHVIGVEEDVGLGAEEGGGVQVEEGDDSDEEVEADEEVGEGVPVYWRYVCGFARRLETIQGVRQMRTKREFVDEIEEVLTRHNRPTDRVKMYFSLLTSVRATLLSIRRMPWFQFRGEVRGVEVDALDGDALLGAGQQVEAAAGEVAEDNFSGNNP